MRTTGSQERVALPIVVCIHQGLAEDDAVKCTVQAQRLNVGADGFRAGNVRKHLIRKVNGSHGMPERDKRVRNAARAGTEFQNRPTGSDGAVDDIRFALWRKSV
jgi:hypothetical protein